MHASSLNLVQAKTEADFLHRQGDASALPPGPNRDALVVSLRKLNGAWHIVSRFGDNVWWPTGKPTNLPNSRTKLDFTKIPAPLRESMKEVIFRYMRRGSEYSGRRPRASTLYGKFEDMLQFVKYAHALGANRIADISRLVCLNYKSVASKHKKKAGTLVKADKLYNKLQAVSALYQLSQYTNDSMPEHPWPDSSAGHIAGSNKRKSQKRRGLTPLMPDDIFVRIFQEAWEIVECAPLLLDWRDELQKFVETKTHLHPTYVNMQKSELLNKFGFNGNYFQLTAKLREIRTACYVVIASLSGCRHHELAYLRKDSYHSTSDDDGEQYWWMRSVSTKTGEGLTEWMIPEAAVTAIQVLERWAQPYHAKLEQEIAEHRANGTTPLQLAEALDHRDALFIGLDTRAGGRVRTVGTHPMNEKLKEFSTVLGLNWKLSTHHFRRKFANYAARSQFGDLRYLKEHFKHWSMDMTLGYALNESQEMELYLEIQDEIGYLKQDVVARWLDKSELLAGGYGESLADWRTRDDNIILFKSRDAMVRSIAESTHIRSNGHAWCTANDNLCVGNDLEKTRCASGCSNAVIGQKHAAIYQGLYDQLKELETDDDIGPSGRARVKRDVSRSAAILRKLGYEVEETTHE
jgi:integrase